jgi:predicted metal-dependent phosphoesterase TrpH
MEWLKADFHLHTNEDYFDHMPHSAYDLIDRGAKLGFEVLAITNHVYYTFDEAWRDYANRRGILLISGVEASIKSSHVLILNADKDVNHLRTFEDLIAYKESHDSVIVAPHAFYPGLICLRRKLFKYADLFDGVEYHSFYTKYFNPNKKAQKFALDHGKTLIGNTDCHRLHMLGKTYTRINAERSLSSILQALRTGKTEIVTRPLTTAEAFKSYIDMEFPHLMMWIDRNSAESPDKSKATPNLQPVLVRKMAQNYRR